MSFVQNHPYDPSKVIAYTAPEGDEDAVYTRGTARLINGEATVTLGETFPLVSNPDVGITAYVTPIEEPVPLAVISKSTERIVVRGPEGSNAEFDYIVWGLRVGFEQSMVIEPKNVEARIPSMARHEQLQTSDPSLRAGLGRKPRRSRPSDTAPVAATASERATKQTTTREPQPDPEQTASNTPPLVGVASTLLPVSEAVEVCELVVANPAAPGNFERSYSAASPHVVGIAASSISEAGQVVVAVSGLISCKVDASYAPIKIGDLLSTSPTVGHAMRANEHTPGTIIAKALEPLDVGIGTIRVLIMSR